MRGTAETWAPDDRDLKGSSDYEEGLKGVANSFVASASFCYEVSHFFLVYYFFAAGALSVSPLIDCYRFYYFKTRAAAAVVALTAYRVTVFSN